MIRSNGRSVGLKVLRLLAIAVLWILVFSGQTYASGGPGERKLFLPSIKTGLPPIIPETTNVIAEDDLSHLTSVSEDGSVFVFTNPSQALRAIDSGEVIVGGISPATPYGFLRKVVDVFRSQDRLVLITEPATLEDAIQQGSVHIRRPLSPGDVAQVKALEGVKLESIPEAGRQSSFLIDISDVVLYDDDGDLSTTDDQIVANGRLEFSSELEFGFTIRDGKLEELTMLNRVVETANLTVSTETSASVSKKKEIARYQLASIGFSVGVVPVWLTPVVTISVGLDGSVTVGVTTSVTQQATLTAGLHYADQSWYPVSELTNDFDFQPPTLNATMDVRGYSDIQIALLLYGVTGPYAGVEPYLRLHVDIQANPWWSLYGGLVVPVGVRLEVMGRTLSDYQQVVINKEVLIAQSEVNTPPELPHHPSPVDGARNQSVQVSLKWLGGDPDGDDVTYDVYLEAGDSSPDVLMCEHVASSSCDPGTLQAATHYYWQVVARDSHGATTVGPVWDFWTAEDNSIDVVLLIDSSGSMSQSDPYDFRKAAAKVFVDAMENGDRLAIVDFDSDTNVLYPLQMLGSNRSVPKQVIDTIDSNGGTNISSALQEGYNQLSHSPTNAPKAAVLMTDGEDTRNYELKATLYANRGWRIFTIGLGEGINISRLRNVANQTGGRFYHLSDPDQLIRVYYDILNATSDAWLLLNRVITMTPGQSTTLDVELPADLASGLFMVDWPGSTVDMTLIDPTGRPITPETANSDPDIYHDKGTTHELYRISNPTSGPWQIRLYGRQLPWSGEFVTVNVSARGGHVSCTPIPSGIISWWPADGTTNDVVDGNPGVLYDQATYAMGKVHQAFDFDGASEVRIASRENLNVQQFTIEAWVFPTLLDGKVEIIVNKEPNINWHPLMIQYELAIKGPVDVDLGSVPEGNLLFYLGGIRHLPNGYQGWVDGGGPLPLYSWSHVALTFDGSTARTYINGNLAKEITGLSGVVTTTSGPLKIGSRSDENTTKNPRDQFNGLIDELAIYGRALSANEIHNIFIAGSAGKCASTP
ncbi:MAG: VWA domain-containing protein [Chloroflexi bacterium]|nr:MAG: VWA domain-containing protein [Chloroflexota bacterium]